MKPEDADNLFDVWTARLTSALAQRVTRKSFLTKLGTFLMVTVGAGTAASLEPRIVYAASCSDWWYCGMHGSPCAACGGSDSSCPSGCSPQSAWTYCCNLPGTNCWYYYTYRDCCGCSPSCDGTYCYNSSEPSWCTSGSYGCTLAQYAGWCGGDGCPTTPVRR